MKTRSGPVGFTLLELTVGLVLTSLALSLGYGAYGMVIDRREAVERVLDADLRATGVRGTVSRWIQGVQAETQPGTALLTGLDGDRDGVPSDELTILTTLEPGPVGRTPVRLFVDRSPETPEEGLVAVWTLPGIGRTERRVLATEITGMDIHYLSGVLGARRWLPSWISTSVLPAAVEIRWSGRPDGSLHPLLRLPLRVPIEAGR